MEVIYEVRLKYPDREVKIPLTSRSIARSLAEMNERAGTPATVWFRDGKIEVQEYPYEN